MTDPLYKTNSSISDLLNPSYIKSFLVIYLYHTLPDFLTIYITLKLEFIVIFPYSTWKPAGTFR